MHAQGVATPVAPSRTASGSGSRGRLTSIVIMAATGVLILAVAYFANAPAAASGVTPVNVTGTANGPAPIVGQAAPGFSAVTVDGTTLNLADYKGSPVWLTFGASWCQPCRAENPDIEAAYEAAKANGVVVIQVYMTEDTTAVADYTSRVGLTYLRVPDPATTLATEYRILGIPSHFFIDRQGVLTQMKVGTLDRASMDSILAGLEK